MTLKNTFLIFSILPILLSGSIFLNNLAIADFEQNGIEIFSDPKVDALTPSQLVENQTFIPKIINSNVVIDGAITADEYAGYISFEDIEIELYWEHNGSDLRIGLISPGTGWVSIGFGDTMMGANMILGGVSNSVAYAVDLHGTSPVSHVNDTNQGGTDDIIDFSSSENATSTFFEFIFPMNSGDILDPIIVENSTQAIFVAYSITSDGLTSYHDGGWSKLGDIYVDYIVDRKAPPKPLDLRDFDNSIPYVAQTSVNIDGTITEGEYEESMYNDITGITLYWEHDNNTLTFALSAPGTGWVSVGFGQRMLGANMIFGGYQNSETYCFDLNGIPDWEHSEDTEQGGSADILSCEATETDTQTTLEFAIPMDSGDPLDPVIEMGSVYAMFLAYQDKSDSPTNIHFKRSNVFNVFIRPPSISIATYVDFTVPAEVLHGEEFMLQVFFYDENLKALKGIPVVFYLQTNFGKYEINSTTTDSQGRANYTYMNEALSSEIIVGVKSKELIKIEEGEVYAYSSSESKQTVNFMGEVKEKPALFQRYSRTGLIIVFWMAGIVIWGSFGYSLWSVILIYQDREKPIKDELPDDGGKTDD